MKKALLIIFIALPFFLTAQNECDFFENSKILIENTRLNSTASDFGPSFVNNELWFSAYAENEIDKLSRGVTKNVFYNIFKYSLDFNGNVSGEKNMDLEEISSGYHAGPVSYCEATKELFVTLSNLENPEIENAVFQKANIRLKIVVLKETGGEWNVVNELPFNSPAYSVGHPAISSTGDTLFFASNIPDYGKGKTDIYMSVRSNGQWGDIKNLGDVINTTNDDMFPFMFRGNMLIFASDGRSDGMGGLDLYYSCLTNSGFSTPENLEDFNTESDDFGLVIHPNEKTGYFSSKRTGGQGDDDIYKVVFSNMVLVSGKVIDDATEQPLSGALVNLTDCDGNQIGSTTSDSEGQISFLIEEADCLKAIASKTPYHDEEQGVTGNNVLLRMKGDYDLELLVRDKQSLEPISNAPVKFSDQNSLQQTDANGIIKRELARNTNYVVASEIEGYMNESVEFSTVKHAIGTINVTINVEKVQVGQTFTLENIFYNFDKWDILPESEVELDKLVKIMNDNPEWKVELGSHTDCRGTDSYNKTLSQKRSDAAVNYIVSNGVARERIVAQGYGETQLVNRCDDGVNCSENEHRENRRTEFKILGMGDN